MKSVPYFLFEDPGWRRFGPLAALRPIWKFRLGLKTIEEIISAQMNATPTGFMPRVSLDRMVKEEYGEQAVYLPSQGEIFLVNSRAWKSLPKDAMSEKHPWTVWKDNQDVIAARLPVEVATKFLSQPVVNPDDYSVRNLLAIWSQQDTVPEIQVIEQPGSLLYWPWDLLHSMEPTIRNDFDHSGYSGILGDVHYRSILVEEDRIIICRGAIVSAGVVIDASHGPVMIMEDVTIQPNAVIMGPAVIGKGSLIKAGAKLFGPLVIGPMCKIGGEVEESLFQGYSNKQHEGFLGHAVVGEWVNLGADTNNSDLKNNYSPVSVTIDGETITTGEQFFGSILGDHVKTGINTMLNTGTVIGVGSSVFGAGFPPKTIPPFTWGGVDEMAIYEFERFIKTARLVMKRRGIDLSQTMTSLLRQHYLESTEGYV